MSTSDLIKFPGGTQDKGLNNFEPSIGSEITWSEDTSNVSGGMRRGVGVRYGMAPLPGQNNTEAVAANQTNGIQKSETTSGTDGLIYRENIYGIVPITMAPYDGSYPKTNRQYYSYLVGLDYGTDVCIDACLGATLVSSVNKQASTLAAGLAQSSYRQESPLVRLHKTEMLNLPQTATPTAADMQAVLKQFGSRYWMPWAHIAVSGKRVPYFWMFAKTTSTPDATTAPSLNLWSKTVSVGTNPTILGGSPSEIITREFTDNNQRLVQIFCMDDDAYTIDLNYQKKITQSNTAAVTAYGSGNNYSGLTSATKAGASTAYASVACALINDPGSYTNTRHDAILIAGEKPIAIIYQDWLQAAKGMMPRWVDLTNPACNPRTGLSVDDVAAPAASHGPTSSFANAGDLINTVSAGVLEANVNYDFGFSFYNKIIDYETNVFYGKTQTIAANLTAMEILTNSGPSANSAWYTMLATADLNLMPWEYSDTSPRTGVETGRGFHINDFEIRFYYRQAGKGEWSPAGNWDAAQLWFYPFSLYSQKALICEQPVGVTVGGRPNGFNDYSPLPNQRYICTVNFQQRAFWWSEKSMHFSSENNIYAYPTRNIVTAKSGKWRGGLVHNRTSPLQDVSRLIVFGDNTYVCRFTGERYKQTLLLVTGTVTQSEVDGSDFTMDYLCEGTAYSFRSSVVAEGVAYWWGPKGVYRYDGLSSPERISFPALEPQVFDYIDTSKEDQVHCVYNKRTHEIIWFYPPKTADATYPTYTLTLNTENGKFYPGKMKCQVDASQNLSVANDNTPSGLTGERIVLHCRASSSDTIQRSYFFDDLVKAGDFQPSAQLEVISFSSITTNTTNDSRRLVLAAGSTSITGQVAAGDYISFQNVKGYAPSLTNVRDMIAKVVAVNTGTPSIDILLPPVTPGSTTLVTWDGSATLTGQTAFPIWHKTPTAAGLNGITWKVQTNYWLPAGLSEAFNWQFLYFLFKYGAIPSPSNIFPEDSRGTIVSAIPHMTLGYRTLVCDGESTDSITLRLNSSGHCQLHWPLKNENRSSNGQALAYSLSGIYIGDPWTLEYLEAHCLKEKGFTLKEFEPG